MNDSKPIQSIANIGNKFQHIEKIILFGSRARGDQEQRSDIDIAICGNEITEKEWCVIHDLIDNLDTLLKIDIVRLDSAGNELKQRIADEGRIIYEKP